MTHVKFWKRPLMLLLILALLSLSSPAYAAESAEIESAQTLYRLGLFQGTIPGRSDESSMALDRKATRGEATTMFIRLLGREGSVQTGSWSHPFSDVPQWAAPYVGYAFQSGLTNGTSSTLFMPQRLITLNEYTTLLLRAAGYDEESGDFSWATAVEKGISLGLYSPIFAAKIQEGMTRGQMAQVSLAALTLPLKVGNKTIGEMLVDMGVIEEGAYADLDIPTGDETSLEIQQVVDLANKARTAKGLAPLILDRALIAAATVRAQEIGQDFSHTRPCGLKFYTVLEEANYPFRAAGENIAMGQSSAQEVMSAWLNSPGHNANILNSSFTKIGVGLIDRQWVQLFAG